MGVVGDTFMTDKQIEALARKNALKSAKQAKKIYKEETLKSDKSELNEADFIFREMKKKEF